MTWIQGRRAGVVRRAGGKFTTSGVRTIRIDSIDFWRGTALAAILVNHIPGNVLGAVTPRNFGFSDAAELFVFLSGVSVSLAYRERFARGARAAATASIFRRAARLYGAHLALTAAAFAVFGLASILTPFDFLSNESARAVATLDPARAALGVAALTHQLAYFNILPMYVAFLVSSPVFLALERRNPLLLLAVSIGIYACARAAGVNLPTWPEPGAWYFNPFAWQLMFVVGIISGGSLRRFGVPFSLTAFRFSKAFTLVAALVVSNVFGLVPGLVDETGRYLDWDKTNLGVVRILDFLTLAYSIHFSRLSVRLEATHAYDFFCRLGRNALPVFCVASLMSALGEILNASSLASPFLDVIFVCLCLFVLHSIASRIDRCGGFVQAG